MGRFAAADHVVAQRKDHGSPWQLPEEAKRPTRTADQRPDAIKLAGDPLTGERCVDHRPGIPG